MPNIENLKPIQKGQRTKEEQKEFATKGGIASGKARRQKKTMQELAKMILSMSMVNGEVHSIEDIQSIAEIKGKNLTIDQMILLKQTEKALKGDLQSAMFIRDTSGNKPIDVQQVIEKPIIEDNI